MPAGTAPVVESTDREIVTTRLFDAPPDRVFEAFSDPARLARWWGPNGFTNTIHEFDLRPGGTWHITMHAPDGVDYRNESVFLEVEKPSKVVFEHLEPIHRFRMAITFAAEAGGTMLTWRMRFDDAEEHEKVKGFVVAANEQNFDRLERELAGTTRETTASALPLPRVVSRDEWRAARKELLAKEKDLTRRRDALNADRRRLPMAKVDKDYVFEGPNGPARLLDLFEGRRQLVVYHFMFDPDAPPPGKSGAPWDEGCPGCSFFADNVPHRLEHLHARGTSFTLVSRAPQAKIAPFKARMGWTAPWYSSFGSDFNYDFHVTVDESADSVEWNYRSTAELKEAGRIPDTKGELPGLSVFLRDGDEVYHTYSTYSRGLDPFLVTYQFLDLTPFGRGEGWGGMPDLDGQGMWWLRHHDCYAAPGLVTLAERAAPAATRESCCGGATCDS